MIERKIAGAIQKLAKKYPVVALTGPRQSGKSTLVKTIFTDYQYVNLENPSLRDFAESDPQGFLQKYHSKVIFDEIQNVPLLFSYIQTIVDERKKMGDFVLTGSSQFKLREAIAQSLAGRVCLFNLLPLSIEELKNSNLLADDFFKVSTQGFYPAIFDRKINASDYYSDYMQTYVERDVRSLINLKDLKVFQAFLKMCAARVGMVVNFTSIGNDLGVSRETIKTWLNVLEASYLLFQLPPYYENLNKRLVKSPKLYFYDVGLLCYLLGVERDHLQSHPSRGAVFENLIINELQKMKLNHHQVADFYFYAEHSGIEIDLIIPHKGKLLTFEMKSSATFHSHFLKNITQWKKNRSTQHHSAYLIYNGEEQSRGEVKVLPWSSLNQVKLL